MMEKKKIVIYQHRRIDTDEIFYIGIGLETRPYDTIGRNKHWKHIVKNTNYKIEILDIVYDWSIAASIEKKLILEYGRRDLGTGTLVNMTDGGEGSLNRLVKPETLQKLSKLAKGRTLSKEWKEKMSKSRTGLKRTTEQKEKARYCQPSMRIVEQYTMDGVLINKFQSINEAARNTNSSYAGIALCCSGKRNKYKNHIWSYGR